MKTPDRVNSLYLDCTCVGIDIERWDQLMERATKANKRTINNLVKRHLPDLYKALGLNYRNPYNYFKTKEHLVLVHSSIEYFLSYN